MAAPYVSEHVVDDDNDESLSSEDDSVDIDEKNGIQLKEKAEDEAEKKTAGNRGWARAMSNVLRTNEKKLQTTSKRDKSVILAKGKTDDETAAIKRKAQKKFLNRGEFEIVAASEDGESKLDDLEGENEAKEEQNEKSRKEIIREIAERRLKKRRWEDMGRVKPDITAREKERFFQRVATAGVVQLFNAVKQRQMNMESRLKKAGSSEVKQERVMKSMTKGDFLDALKGAKSIGAPSKAAKRVRGAVPTVQPSWNVLSENYMMGAKMKDWDKESDSEGVEAPKKVSDSSDDDDDAASESSN